MNHRCTRFHHRNLQELSCMLPAWDHKLQRGIHCHSCRFSADWSRRFRYTHRQCTPCHPSSPHCSCNIRAPASPCRRHPCTYPSSYRRCHHRKASTDRFRVRTSSLLRARRHPWYKGCCPHSLLSDENTAHWTDTRRWYTDCHHHTR